MQLIVQEPYIKSRARLMSVKCTPGRMFLRIVCAPNVKQIVPVGKLLKLGEVTDQQLQKYVLKDKLKMRCEQDGELIVQGIEDTWIIKGIGQDQLSLWHNNSGSIVGDCAQ